MNDDVGSGGDGPGGDGGVTQIAGHGPEEAGVAALARQLGLADDVALLGYLTDDKLTRAYAQADVFVFPSRTDTFGQVILEAQASGLPVIAVAEGGPADLVRDGVTGVLSPSHSGALADAVAGLAAAPERRARLARAALADVSDRSWERALERLAAGYRAALAAHATTGARRAA